MAVAADRYALDAARRQRPVSDMIESKHNNGPAGQPDRPAPPPQQQQQPPPQQQQAQQPQQQQPLQRSQFPPNHPLGNSKHLCAICGDRATGKHYGVFSCEGCKGFFKRTIRKDIVYVCRAASQCLIDMRQRNRCQHCRYQKCLRMGMKREAVQEEKQRLRLRAQAAMAQAAGAHAAQLHLAAPAAAYAPYDHDADMADAPHYLPGRYYPQQQQQQISSSADRYQPAEQSAYAHQQQQPLPGHRHWPAAARQQVHLSDDAAVRWAAQAQIEQLVEWAKSVPKFQELLVDDQVTLLRAHWNELLIADIAFRSVDYYARSAHAAAGSKQGAGTAGREPLLCIGRGVYVAHDQAHELSLGTMFDRIQDELVAKMHQMRIDPNEITCLRAIILFNPETHGLKTSQPIEEYRSNIYTTLEAYCRQHYDDQPNRFGKLLLRLPALRSIGLKCDSTRRCDSQSSSSTTASAAPAAAADSTAPPHHPHPKHKQPAAAAGPYLSSQQQQFDQLGGSSPSSSSCASSASGSAASNLSTCGPVSTTTACGVNSPAAANSNGTGTGTGTGAGAGAKGQTNTLLFFDLCYDSASIDSFLRSYLSSQHHMH